MDLLWKNRFGMKYFFWMVLGDVFGAQNGWIVFCFEASFLGNICSIFLGGGARNLGLSNF